MGVATTAGVDKLVLADKGSGIPGFGDWAEQLIAESTGKNGKGILPVVVPSLEAPNFDPSTPDEVLVTLGPGLYEDAPPASGWGAAVDAPLGAQMLLWEYATVVAGRMIGINPFDQPDVESAKQAARDMLEGPATSPSPTFTDGPVEVFATEGLLSGESTRHRRRDDAARPGRPRARLPRRDGLPRPRASRALRRRPRVACRAHRATDHVRLGAAVPALHRPVPQGRAPRRRLPAGHRRAAGGPRDPRPAVHVRRLHQRPGDRRRVRPRRPRTSGAASAPHRAEDGLDVLRESLR